MTTTTANKIEIANDNDESQQFRDWLIAQGHDARVGRSTGNYVNGIETSADNDANEIMRTLWSAYCNS